MNDNQINKIVGGTSFIVVFVSCAFAAVYTEHRIKKVMDRLAAIEDRKITEEVYLSDELHVENRFAPIPTKAEVDRIILSRGLEKAIESGAVPIVTIGELIEPERGAKVPE